ncbi:MAG: hypothetical protein JWP34_4474 [Massilia sp.]|jgi:plasmid maintenance system antidote protein VapI|nr:hypothetical protein [Massilia sp.]
MRTVLRRLKEPPRPSEEPRHFGDFLHQITRNANVSPSHVSDICAVPVELVEAWFAGSELIEPGQASAIARYLGLMGSELLRFQELYEKERLEETVEMALREASAEEVARRRRVRESRRAAEGHLKAAQIESAHQQVSPSKPRQVPPGPPPLFADPDGDDGRPAPQGARTADELIAVLRMFWKWAGGYSSRQLSQWSNGAFSHATVSALLSEHTTVKRPPLTLAYLQGIIRACGGQEDELRQWTKAWRLVQQNGSRHEEMAEIVHLSERHTGTG